MKSTGTESHHSLAAGETCHDSLRRIYHNVRATHPTLHPEHALSITVNSHNDTANEYGLVPSPLVFGIRPLLNVGFNDARPNQAARFQAMADARSEMEKHMTERRVSVALSKKTPGSATRSYHPSDEIMIFREKFSNVKLHKWIGPIKVTQQSGKNLEVQHTNP